MNFCVFLDSVCIASMSVDITRRTIERSQTGIQMLERTVDKLVHFLII